MSEIISLDAHKRYSLAGVETVDGKRALEERIEHRRGARPAREATGRPALRRSRYGVC